MNLIKRVTMTTVVSILLLGCGGGDNSSESEQDRRAIVIPAYFYDSEIWQRVIDAQNEDVDYFVIVNPSNGVGEEKSEHYSSIIEELNRNGKKGIGYIYTSYGNRDLADVKSEIEKWIEYYPEINGFFFDEVNSSLDKINYYETLFNYVKDKNKNYFVMYIPLKYEKKLFEEVADAVVIYENSYKEFENSICSNYKKGVIIVYDTTEKQMKDIISNNDECKLFYISDDTLPNPYDQLPTYFEGEIEELQK